MRISEQMVEAHTANTLHVVTLFLLWLISGCSYLLGTSREDSYERKYSRLVRKLTKSGWASTIVFVDPRRGNDVWMRVGVKPQGLACISTSRRPSVTTVPIPSDARRGHCGDKSGKLWYEHDRGVGVVEMRRGDRRRRSFLKLGWRHVGGQSRVFSMTLVLPDEYEWTGRHLRKLVNSKGRPAQARWKAWRHNILSVRIRDVHVIKGRISFRLRKTPLEEQLLNAYTDCRECIRRTDRGVVLGLPVKVLFFGGKAVLTPPGTELLRRFFGIVQRHVKRGYKLSVEGHTDDRPIQFSTFRSNWYLSVARACAVAHYFLKRGVKPKYLQAVGHAANYPLATNKTAAGRARNRRVEILFDTRSKIRTPRKDVPGPERQVRAGTER